MVSFLLSGRLVRLKKKENGVRPVGIGETLRRIMGKTVARVLKDDIQLASGTLQTCAGLESGIEASIHAMRRTFEEDGCEAVLLVDADNAFNRLNREMALKTINQKCPVLFKYLHNSYNTPSKLYLNDGSYILSKEGATQGDNLAMAMYAIATKPLIEELAHKTVKQVWFADDSTAGGKLDGIFEWWTKLKEVGPTYGYHPKPSKTYLILKHPNNLTKAETIFNEEGINITYEGERHIGVVLGTEEFKVKYVRDKVDKWTRDISKLAEITKEEPQVALSAFNTVLSHRWTFLQRTVADIGPLFEPLEQTIRNELIPAIIGRNVSDMEREIISLPYRFGGLGIQIPPETEGPEYRASKEITNGLTDLIFNQDDDVQNLDKVQSKQTRNKLKTEKEKILKTKVDLLKEQLSDTQKRAIEAAEEKAASAWLTSLPIKSLGYALNKQECRDAIALKYGWTMKDIPNFCACGKENSVDHTLICKKDGCVSLHHNSLRDTEAMIMKGVYKDVQTEPVLLPTEAELRNGANMAERARLDMSARGVFGLNERTFFDVRITHPNANYNQEKTMEQIYHHQEMGKKRMYNDRIIQVEKASFVPLIFTTSGGLGPECDRLNKRLAEKICTKRNETYSSVIQHIRTRLRFALLRSTLVAIRGFRGKNSYHSEDDLIDISFNLIPEEQCYESY